MDITSLVFLLLLFCLGSLIVSCAEVALFVSSQLKLEIMRNDETIQAKFWKYFDNNQIFLARLFSLAKLICLSGSIFGLSRFLTSNYSNNSFGFYTITFVSILVFYLVINEILPLIIVSKQPEKLMNFLVAPLFLIILILFLPAKLFSGIIDSFGKRKKNLTTRRVKRWYAFSTIHTKPVSEESHDEEAELQILQNAIDFTNIRARDCMVPRTEIVAVEFEESMEVLKNLFIEKGLSKILIFKTTEDNIIGYVHSFEMFKNPTSIAQVLHPISFVPSAIPGKELLEIFAKQSGNISVVVDEYGGTAGIVTIEDVIEEIFGEIEDEHDKEDLFEVQLSPNEFRFSARAEIDYLNENYKLNLPESENYETLAGLIFHILEEIPEVGRKIDLDEYTLLVEEVSDRRIEVVKVTILEVD